MTEQDIIIIILITTLLVQVATFFLNKKQTKMTQDVAAEVAKLTGDLQSETSAENAVVSLLQSVVAQLEAIGSASADPDTVAALEVLHTSLAQNTAALAQAVVANTPAAPAQ